LRLLYPRKEGKNDSHIFNNRIKDLKKWIVFLLIGAVISLPTACSSKVLTAQGVIDKFITAGLNVGDVHVEERVPESPLPNSYTERLAFSIPEVAPKGGQVFTCETKKNCDALYAYFDILKGLAGPYLYQSLNGKVVVQLNSGLSPETASKFEDVVNSLP
jgi:hypothetical protein